MNNLKRAIDAEKERKKKKNEEYEKKRNGKKGVLTDVRTLPSYEV